MSLIERREFNKHLPMSTRTQPACENCKYCTILRHYDDPYEYICGRGAPPRPERGPMPNLFDEEQLKKWSAAGDAQDEWQQYRQTGPADICDHWEKRGE